MNARTLAFRAHRAALRGVTALVFGILGPGVAALGAEPPKGDPAQGKELFFREWTLGDARSHGGDGLGPVYNESSCVVCHNAGGPGGAGPASRNVDILSAFSNQAAVAGANRRPSFLFRALGALVGVSPEPADTPAAPRKPDTRELVKAHPGFRTARSVVLHRFGVDAGYEGWRIGMLGLGGFAGAPGGLDQLNRAVAEINQIKTLAQFENNVAFQNQAQFGEFSLAHSQRNPTALFGAGLIDAIPDDVIEAAAKVDRTGQRGVAGRVSRQKDGRIGRFGWKAQTPSLSDFVLTACAVELGLEVPGHHQGGLPQAADKTAPGLDLSEAECASLVAYVRILPRPVALSFPAGAQERSINEGKELFAKVGCNACHRSKLGEVDGIYSDLLLHDMGPELGDTGAYGVFVPDTSEPDFVDPDQPIAAGAVPSPLVQEAVVAEAAVTPAAPPDAAAPQAPATGPARRQEWRTPPLWGFRDSGPYLHDGRAQTLEQTLAFHGGEATQSAQQYFQLTPQERLKLQAFLKSLVAPTDRPVDAED